MFYFRLMFICAVVIFVFFSWVAIQERHGGNLNDIMPALGGGEPELALAPSAVNDKSCMPRKIGNMYFRISTPNNFCYCLGNGVKDQEEIIASGSSLEEYKAMCVDIAYGKYAEKACREINSVLAKNNKKSSVDCDCLYKGIKENVMHLAVMGGKFKLGQGTSTLVSGYDYKTAKNGASNHTPFYKISRSFVERCTKIR